MILPGPNQSFSEFLKELAIILAGWTVGLIVAFVLVLTLPKPFLEFLERARFTGWVSSLLGVDAELVAYCVIGAPSVVAGLVVAFWLNERRLRGSPPPDTEA